MKTIILATFGIFAATFVNAQQMVEADLYIPGKYSAPEPVIDGPCAVYPHPGTNIIGNNVFLYKTPWLCDEIPESDDDTVIVEEEPEYCEPKDRKKDKKKKKHKGKKKGHGKDKQTDRKHPKRDRNS
jgi:hypothetical protein